MSAPSFLHYKAGPGRSDKGAYTACGFYCMVESTTTDKPKVTCRHCIKKMDTPRRQQGSGPDEAGL